MIPVLEQYFANILLIGDVCTISGCVSLGIFDSFLYLQNLKKLLLCLFEFNVFKQIKSLVEKQFGAISVFIDCIGTYYD